MAEVSDEIVATLVRILADTYGHDGLRIARQQALGASVRSAKTWKAVVARMSSQEPGQ
jgi:hypothetical protein